MYIHLHRKTAVLTDSKQQTHISNRDTNIITAGMPITTARAETLATAGRLEPRNGRNASYRRAFAEIHEKFIPMVDQIQQKNE